MSTRHLNDASPILPPLPEPGGCDSKYNWGGQPYEYTAQDMTDYALEAVMLDRMHRPEP
jgi:hypothetical protein